MAELPSTVVVEATPRMLLVEAEQEELQALVEALPHWVVAPEQSFPLPDTRKRAERPPDPDPS